MPKTSKPPFKTKFKITHRTLTKWKIKSNKVKKYQTRNKYCEQITLNKSNYEENIINN